MSVCVYVAGAYRAHDRDIVTLQDNMRLGLNLSAAALEAGYAVFVPWLDFQLTLRASGPIPSEIMLAHSLGWMERADVVLVQPLRCELSKGTQKELERATELGIPVVYSLEELKDRFPIAHGPWIPMRDAKSKIRHILDPDKLPCPPS